MGSEVSQTFVWSEIKSVRDFIKKRDPVQDDNTATIIMFTTTRLLFRQTTVF